MLLKTNLDQTLDHVFSTLICVILVYLLLHLLSLDIQLEIGGGRYFYTTEFAWRGTLGIIWLCHHMLLVLGR